MYGAFICYKNTCMHTHAIQMNTDTMQTFFTLPVSQLTILRCCNVAATVSLVMVTFYFYVVTTCFCMVGVTFHDIGNNVVP